MNRRLGVLISGDQVLPRISSNVSVFPTEPDGDPLTDWINSCHKLRNAVDADVLTLPSHNEPFEGLHDRLNNKNGTTATLDPLAATPAVHEVTTETQSVTD